MEASGSGRIFKSHGALEWRVRGSPAYKARLKQRAFARVLRHREEILRKARSGDCGGAKEELRSMLECEVEAMDEEEQQQHHHHHQEEEEEEEEEQEEEELDVDVETTSDLPDELYEEILYEMCLQVQSELEAERYEEFARFDEEALQNAIDANPMSSVEPMDLSE